MLKCNVQCAMCVAIGNTFLNPAYCVFSPNAHVVIIVFVIIDVNGVVVVAAVVAATAVSLFILADVRISDRFVVNKASSAMA